METPRNNMITYSKFRCDYVRKLELPGEITRRQASALISETPSDTCC